MPKHNAPPNVVAEVPKELQHPLGPKLHKAFSAMLQGPVEQGHSELLSVIEDDSEIMLHRGHAVNTTHKGLGRYISRWLMALTVANPSSAVLAIQCFLNVEFVDEATRTVLLARLLSQMITTCELGSEPSLITAVRAAETWGSLLAGECWLIPSIIESELQQAIEWFAFDPQGRRRFVGNIMLQQIALISAASFLPYLEKIMLGMWDALRDEHLPTRVATAMTLKLALQLGSHPQHAATVDASTLWDEAIEIVSKLAVVPRKETRHGALVALQAVMLVAVERGGSAYQHFSQQRLNAVWNHVLRLLPETQLPDFVFVALTDLLPIMAQYSKSWFINSCIPVIIPSSAAIFRGDKSTLAERSQMFTVLGRLALELSDYVSIFAGRVLQSIEYNLVPRNKRERCDAAVSCLAMMARADPKTVRPFVIPMMDAIFSGEPTLGFATDIQALCTVFKELQSMCLDRIVKQLRDTLALQHQSYPARGAGGDDLRGDPRLVAMLDALSALDFTGYNILPFLVERVLPHLSHQSSRVRTSAAACCAKLVFCGCHGWKSPCKHDEFGALEHQGRLHIDLILKVQSGLLGMAVADPDGDVRLLALQLLRPEFDITLASQEPCRTLFPALSDKPTIRHCAMRLLGRLSRRNPGCVFPMLRRTIIQCSTELRFLDHVRRQEQAATLLGTLVDAAPALVAPYAPALLQDVAAKLRATSPPTPTLVLTAVLATIHRLVLHIPSESLDDVRALTDIVVQHVLEEGPQQKRIEAIRALTSIVRVTHAIDIYTRFPQLLSTLTSTLHGGHKQNWSVRYEALTLLGAIGAVDPVRVKALTAASAESADGSSMVNAAGGPISFTRGHDDEVIARYALNVALAVVSQSSVDDECCKQATRALVRIFDARKLHLRASVQAMRRVFPEVLKQIHGRPKIREDLFTYLAMFTAFVSQHVRSFLQDIYSVVTVYITSDDGPTVRSIVYLVVELRHHLNEEFAPYVPHLLPLLVQVCDAKQQDVSVMTSVMDAFQHFGSLLSGHLHVVLPCIIDAACDTTADAEIRIHALQALRRLAWSLPSLIDYASRCIHALCRVLSEPTALGGSNSRDTRERSKVIHNEAYDALRATIEMLGHRYAKFDHSVRPVVVEAFRNNTQLLDDFARLVGDVVVQRTTDRQGAAHDPRYPPLPNPLTQLNALPDEPQQTDPRFTAAMDHLSRITNLSEDEWSTWLRQFCIALLGDCQVLALRVCLGLARVHEPSARQLFHPTFASCFAAMAPELQRLVVQRLGATLDNPRTPKEVDQELLNLAEYMERAETFKRASADHQLATSIPAGSRPSAHTSSEPLSQLHAGLFPLHVLIAQSERCNLHAKALHYAEIHFSYIQRDIERAVAQRQSGAIPVHLWKSLFEVSEKLIGLNTRLNKSESATGILEYVKVNFYRLAGEMSDELRFSRIDMFEKLQWWADAYKYYKNMNRQKPNISYLAGMCRALDGMGDFQTVTEQWKATVRNKRNKKELAALAPFAARAAWLMQRWDDLSEAIEVMTGDDEHGVTTPLFYRAILALRRGDTATTRRLITECRVGLDKDLSAVVAESYDRAYPLLVGLQQLSELEELAMLNSSTAFTLPRLNTLWKLRLNQMSTSAVHWQGTLANHAMATPPEDDLSSWLRFVTICVRSQRYRMAENVLHKLLGGGGKNITAALERRPPQPIQLAVSAAQYLFEAVSPTEAVKALERFTSLLEETDAAGSSIAECCTELANWRLKMQPDYVRRKEDFVYVMGMLQRAKSADARSTAAWRTWATVNKEFAAAAMEYNNKKPTSSEAEGFALAAIDGFLHCLEREPRLEDVLGLLSMWFTYGAHYPAVTQRVNESVRQVPNDVWLGVIPQIMARIHTPQQEITDGVADLLRSVAEHHPQALLFSLNVNVNATAQGSDVAERRTAAQKMLAHLRRAHGSRGELMTNHAHSVSQELIRCAIMWIEQWYEAIDEAWRLFNTPGTTGDLQVMLAVFEPLMEKLDNPQTPADRRFLEDYGQEVRAGVLATRNAAAKLAASQIGQFTSLDEAPPEVKTAWDLFTKEHGRMEAELRPLMSLLLQYVSPELERLCSTYDPLSLVMPGHYQPGRDGPRIRGFESTLKVMASKNRPRRVVIVADDGQHYKHLLKGQEDMRLDERVMQLLGLVNTMLVSNMRTSKLDMSATTYAVTPLSDNVGLVGWVDHCDTLNDIIRLYREATGIPNTREWRLMLSQCDKLESLTLMQKVETLEYALDNTDGMDVARVMWVRSASAESWLDCRTTYVRTLGSQSMIGYVLGLGDRHPSNLMLAKTGRIVHIDFGDCFEVAMLRSNLPERVPFRLTRMLQKAMETGGIDGIFRHTCEAAMTVLRMERDNVMAMLEAFVHDPLITWRIMAEEGRTRSGADAGAADPGRTRAVTSSDRNGTFGGAATLSKRVGDTDFAPGSKGAPLQSMKTRNNPQQPIPLASHTKRAQEVVGRIRDKLMGMEDPRIPPRIAERGVRREQKTVKEQVARLIRQASSNENLCQSYQGWCPFW